MALDTEMTKGLFDRAPKKENSNIKKDIKRLTINISQDMFKKLKVYSAENDTTMGEVVEKLIKNNIN